MGNPHTLYTEFHVLLNSSQHYINKCVNLEKRNSRQPENKHMVTGNMECTISLPAEKLLSITLLVRKLVLSMNSSNYFEQDIRVSIH